MSRNKVERIYNQAQFDDQFQSIPINRRRCVIFAPDHPNDNLCHCNRSENAHPTNEENNIKKTQIWQINSHTIKDWTKEQSVSLVNGSPYVRCDIETDPEIVKRILFDVWQIDEPSLLMQITGGHKYFKLNHHVDSNLIDNLVDFCSQSKTCLFTDGIAVGIVQLIGKAIRKRKLTKLNDRTTVVGICNYGSVKNLQDFQRVEHKEIFEGNSTNEEKSQKSSEQNLEMNHTHYILLDDGTIQHYGIDDYRSRLVQTISRSFSKISSPVPIVTILFEGGEDSIRSIYNDLRRKIPVIIVNNTGRIADFLIRWLSRTQEFEIDTEWKKIIDPEDDYFLDSTGSILFDSSINSRETTGRSNSKFELRTRTGKHLLKSKFEKYLNSISEDLNQSINGISLNRRSMMKQPNQIKQVNSKLISMILFALQPKVRSNLIVFNPKKSEQLKEIILKSVAQNVNNSRTGSFSSLGQEDRSNMDDDYLLNLSIDWDCINTAKEWIVQDLIDNIHDKNKVFIRALTKQRHQFINYFINLGLQIDEVFFDPKSNPFASRDYHQRGKRYDQFISIVYNDQFLNRPDWILRDVVKTKDDFDRQSIRSTEDLNELFRSLIGGYVKPLYYDSQIEEQEDRMGVKRFTNIISPKMKDLEQGPLIGSDSLYKDLARDYIIRDLFLWSIVMNYMDLAKVFLGHTKDRTCAALIATEILTHLHENCSDVVHGDKKVELKRWIHYFEDYAIKSIDLCFKNDPDMSRLLIIQRVELFGDVNCLQVADDAKSKRFASHPCSRQAKNSIWYDKLDPDQHQIKYYLGLLIGLWSLGILAPFTARFTNFHQQTILTEPTLQPYGINYSDPYANNPYPDRFYRKIHQIWLFHQSLHVKYNYHHIEYIAFLFLFSYMMLFHFEVRQSINEKIPITESIVIIIVTCFLIEEIRHFFNQESLTFIGKCHSYFRFFFKQLTALSFVLFYIGIVFKLRTVGNSSSFQASKIILGYDLWIWWIRSLSFIIVNPYLGPHLVSLGKMLKNLSFFAILIAIVMTAYGVASRSMAFYGNLDFTILSIAKSVLYPVYYLLYTNVSGELAGLDENIDVTPKLATHILLAFHMLLINILMVNLLIAMFNKSFQDVVEVQSDVWNFQQFAVVREYYHRSPLFVPLSTILDLISLMKMFYRWYLRVRYNYVDPTEKVFKVIAVQAQLELDWRGFETASTYVYAQNQASNKTNKIFSDVEDQQRSTVSRTKLDLNDSLKRKENQSIDQLRQEIKNSIKELRNDIRLLNKQQ